MHFCNKKQRGCWFCDVMVLVCVVLIKEELDFLVSFVKEILISGSL